MASISRKSNYIELKTLEYYFNGNTKKAENVYKIRHYLKSDWFELFIKLYFEKFGIDMSDISWQHPDWWIDLKWYINGEKVYIQCKKYTKNHTYRKGVTIWDIRGFLWWIVSIDRDYTSAKKIFINTADYSSPSRRFAKENDIELWDYTDIASICEEYNFEEFKKDIKLQNLESNKYISDYQQWLFPVFYRDLNENDIYIYLANIREKLAVESKSSRWFVYSNPTLKAFAKNRPYNLEVLKKTWNIEEDSNTDFYWREILKWLQLLRD